MKLEITTSGEQETMDLGAKLVQSLPTNSVVSLNGTLGAGKSVLVRGFAIGLGIDPEVVTSPTFTLWQTYQGQQTLHHLDAYRLDRVEDFYDLGGEELLDSAGWKLIEWGDRIKEALPDVHVRIDLMVVTPEQRKIVVQSLE